MKYTIPQKLLLEMDEERRQAERQAHLSGSTDDRLRALMHRVRQGVVNPEYLEIAARLGDQEALQILSQSGSELPEPYGHDWLNLALYNIGDKRLILNLTADCFEEHSPTALVKGFANAIRSADRERCTKLIKFVYTIEDPTIAQAFDVILNAIAHLKPEELGAHTKWARWYDAAEAIETLIGDGEALSREWVYKRLLQYLKGEV